MYRTESISADLLEYIAMCAKHNAYLLLFYFYTGFEISAAFKKARSVV